MIKNASLEKEHLIQTTFPIPDEITGHIEREEWVEVDNYFLSAEKPGGVLYTYLQKFLQFHSIEHIISIRTAPDDEDGIWHDDGSRIIGFTISLTRRPEELIGGHLLFRSKETLNTVRIPTRSFGEMLIFKTGIYGFEHMVTKVSQGKRILIAGWCS